MGELFKLKRGDLREALIEYAYQAAQDGHIEVMSLRQAARDLGVSSGAVYRHFTDKESLLAEITRLGFLDLRNRFTAIRAENDPAKTIEQSIDRFLRITRTYIYFAIESPALWHMMFGRIGVACREDIIKDPEMMRYTPFDVCIQNADDLYNLGGLPRKLDMKDHRFAWSATHGAADLAQSGARMDADQLDMVCEDTCTRNLRAMGYQEPKAI